ncbi:hypothetical protein [Dactylosporangium sp. NPDC000521]|uniref:hypothetical protein n=1 Tax=Dactylosporangium sp. NPDC000521 TaxID=3363975 RepID=UPI0036CABE8C
MRGDASDALPGGDRDKDIEILSLRHQLAVLQRQLDGQRVRFEPVDRAWLAALLHPLPRPTLRRLRLLVRPDTVLKWHRDLIARRHAALSRHRRRGRPAARNLVMDLEDAGCNVKYLIRDRDGKYPGMFDAILADAAIKVVLSGIQVPRMNAIMERWVRTCRRELLDRTLIEHAA